MQVEKPQQYVVTVEPNKTGNALTIVVDEGEPQETDSFEFVAPLGTGFVVRRVTRIELVPETPKSKW